MTTPPPVPDTKTRLLDLADEGIRRGGLAAVSFGQLARGVGVKTSSVHYHFRTKADLLGALLTRYHAEFENLCAVFEKYATAGGPRLHQIVAFYEVSQLDAKRMCLCAALSGSGASVPPALVRQIRDFRAMVRDWLAACFALGSEDGTIRDVGAPEAEAAAALALIEGAQLGTRSEGDPEVFKAATAQLLGRIVAPASQETDT